MDSKRRSIYVLGINSLLPSSLLAADLTSGLATQNSEYFPEALVQTHDGRTLRFYSDLVKGKIVIINMMYTACTRTCPPNTASLMAVQDGLGERVGNDIFMYSITLQPEIDTPDALRDYAGKYGAKPGWTFLRAKRPDLEIIRRKLGFFNSDPVADADISTHAGMIRIGNEARDRWFMMPVLSSTRQILKSVQNI